MLEKHLWNPIWLYLVVQIWQLVHEKTQQTFVGLLEDVFTFKTCLESWRRLQNVFSVTISGLPRCLEDVLQIRLEDVLKTSWKTKNCYAEDILKTSWRYVLNTSSRRPGDRKYLLGISLSNKSKSVSDKSISHVSTSDKSRRIQNAFISTQ